MKSIHGKGPAPQGNAAALYQSGLAAFEQGRLPEAIERLSAIADQRNLPGTLARFYLGQAHQQHGLNELRLGRYASAARHLTSAREINPASAGLGRYLLACHVGRGRYDLAVAELEKTVGAGQSDDAAPIRLAHALARDGQHDRAMETLREAIDHAPLRVELRVQLGLLLAATEDFSGAVEVLEEAARLAPLDVVVQQHMGLAMAAGGDVLGGVRHLAIAQKLRPHDAYLSLLLAWAADAAQRVETNLTVDPAPIKAVPKDEAAMEGLGDLIIQEPGFVEAFLSLPESEVDPEIFALLASVLEKALERQPDYADLHYHCSRVYARLGRTESAIAAANQATRLNPRYVQALIQLGRLYASTDRSAEAIERLQTALDSGGNYPDVHFMLGELYRTTGRPDRARGSYRRALELNSDYQRAQGALEALASA